VQKLPVKGARWGDDMKRVYVSLFDELQVRVLSPGDFPNVTPLGICLLPATPQGALEISDLSPLFVADRFYFVYRQVC